MGLNGLTLSVCQLLVEASPTVEKAASCYKADRLIASLLSFHSIQSSLAVCEFRPAGEERCKRGHGWVCANLWCQMSCHSADLRTFGFTTQEFSMVANATSQHSKPNKIFISDRKPWQPTVTDLVVPQILVPQTIYEARFLPSYTPVSFTNTALQYNRLSIICRTAEEELGIQCCSAHSPVLLTPRSLFWAGVSWIFLAERWVLVYSVRSYKAHSRNTASRASSAREGKLTDFKINKPDSHVHVMTA